MMIQLHHAETGDGAVRRSTLSFESWVLAESAFPGLGDSGQ